MKLCPIAIVAGCKKCPAYRVCIAKGILGDYEKPSPEVKATKDQSASTEPMSK